MSKYEHDQPRIKKCRSNCCLIDYKSSVRQRTDTPEV